MKRLELTLGEPAANLALDEALLDEVERFGPSAETLRFWESPSPLVVLGRSSIPEREIHAERCRCDGVPVLRRASGGAAVLAGPGCLMYAVALDRRTRPELVSMGAAHRAVLGRIAAALNRRVPGVRCEGTSDLVLDQPGGARKFSGNSIRARREALLYHGTILYDFPIVRIERYLTLPPRRPAYRADRPHTEFLANLPLARDAIVAAMAEAWDARSTAADWPGERTAALVAERYGREAWP